MSDSETDMPLVEAAYRAKAPPLVSSPAPVSGLSSPCSSSPPSARDSLSVSGNASTDGGGGLFAGRLFSVGTGSQSDDDDGGGVEGGDATGGTAGALGVVDLGGSLGDDGDGGGVEGGDVGGTADALGVVDLGGSLGDDSELGDADDDQLDGDSYGGSSSPPLASSPSRGGGGDGTKRGAAAGPSSHDLLPPSDDESFDGLDMPQLYICLKKAKYPVIRAAAKRLGWKISTKKGTIAWLDAWSGDDLQKLGPQKINHFPGMKEICNKASLARHLNRMKITFRKEYNFFPNTWVLPTDMPRLQEFFARLRLASSAGPRRTPTGAGKSASTKPRRPASTKSTASTGSASSGKKSSFPRLKIAPRNTVSGNSRSSNSNSSTTASTTATGGSRPPAAAATATASAASRGAGGRLKDGGPSPALPRTASMPPRPGGPPSGRKLVRAGTFSSTTSTAAAAASATTAAAAASATKPKKKKKKKKQAAAAVGGGTGGAAAGAGGAKPKAARRKAPILIVKPDDQCQGRGIYMTTGPEGIVMENPVSPVVVQTYLPRPLLIDGHKFDMRLYVLVSSAWPTWRVFLHREGLARFCTVPYEAPSTKNLSKSCMHLTNFALNRRHKSGGPKTTKLGRRPKLPRIASPTKLGPETSTTEDDDKGEGDGDGDQQGGRSPPRLDTSLPAVSTAMPSPRPDSVTSSTASSPRDVDDDVGDGGDGDGGSGGSGDGSPSRDDDDDDDDDESVVSDRFCAFGESTPSDPELYETKGCKWSLTALFNTLQSQGVDVDKLWKNICDVVSKTTLTIRPRVEHLYRASRAHCRSSPVRPSEEEQGFFVMELLGFDIMLDSKFKPWLVEVNQSPSFETSSPLDAVIKEEVIADTLALGAIDEKWLLSHAHELLPGEDMSDDEAEPVVVPASAPAPAPKKSGSASMPSSSSTNANTKPGAAAPPPTIVVNEDALPLSAYSRWILRLREAYEDRTCGRFVRLLPSDSFEAIKNDVPSSLRRTVTLERRRGEALEQRRLLQARQKDDMAVRLKNKTRDKTTRDPKAGAGGGARTPRKDVRT